MGTGRSPLAGVLGLSAALLAASCGSGPAAPTASPGAPITYDSEHFHFEHLTAAAPGRWLRLLAFGGCGHARDNSGRGGAAMVQPSTDDKRLLLAPPVDGSRPALLRLPH